MKELFTNFTTIFSLLAAILSLLTVVSGTRIFFNSKPFFNMIKNNKISLKNFSLVFSKDLDEYRRKLEILESEIYKIEDDRRKYDEIYKLIKKDVKIYDVGPSYKTFAVIDRRLKKYERKSEEVFSEYTIHIHNKDILVKALREKEIIKKSSHEKDTPKRNIPSETIIPETELIVSSLFLKDKLKIIYKAYYFIIAAGFILTIFSIFFNINLIIGIVLLSLLLILIIYQKLLQFRIENGLFGTNLYEAKELLGFILINKDKFGNGNGEKIFHDEKMAELILRFEQVIEAGGFSNGI